MSEDKMNALMARYLTAEQKEALDRSVAAMPADFDHAAHDAKWKGLSARIKAALPLDPGSPQAQAFLDEWDEMIRPFLAVSSPEMLAGVKTFHDSIEEWDGHTVRWRDGEMLLGGEGIACVRKYYEALARARNAVSE